MPYELHFPTQTSMPLACTELARTVGQVPAEAAAAVVASGPRPPAPTYETEELWREVSNLKWRAASDGTVPAPRAAAPLVAARRLAELFAARYPAAAPLTLGERMQIVAMGQHIADIVGPSPDLLNAIKNDLQPIDLARLLP